MSIVSTLKYTFKKNGALDFCKVRELKAHSELQCHKVLFVEPPRAHDTALLPKGKSKTSR